MKLAEYQQEARKTGVFPSEVALMYTTLGLVGEAGEIANKVKKTIRDDNGQLTPERRADVLDELGDVLWYVAALCTALEADLSEVAAQNLTKLQSRYQRGAIRGDGDRR